MVKVAVTIGKSYEFFVCGQRLAPIGAVALGQFVETDFRRDGNLAAKPHLPDREHMIRAACVRTVSYL